MTEPAELSPRCREPRCPCQTSPLWRDRTPDENDKYDGVTGDTEGD